MRRPAGPTSPLTALLLLACVGFAAAPETAAARSYDVVDLGPTGGSFIWSGVNDSAQVVGTETVETLTTPVVWTAGSSDRVFEPSLLGYGTGIDIAANGDVAGGWHQGSNAFASVWVSGAVVNVGNAGMFASRVSLSDGAILAGWGSTQIFRARPPAYMLESIPFDVDHPDAVAVNDEAEVVFGIGHTGRAGFWHDLTAEEIAVEPWGPHALNNVGDVVGRESLTSNAVLRRANGDTAPLTPLDGATAANTFAYAINDAGLIAGRSNGAGVVWEDGVPSRLVDALAAADGWTAITDALDVSQAGNILVRGTRNGVEHWGLLTVHPTLTVSLGAGVTNGNVFSVDVTVTNQTPTALDDLHFAEPAAVTPAAPGIVSTLDGPSPPLGTALAAGASITSSVSFDIEKVGAAELVSGVSAHDPDDTPFDAMTDALVEIGTRRLDEAELKRVYADALLDSSQSAGAVLNAANIRVGDVTAWAVGPNGGETVPPWLNVSVNVQPVPPPNTGFAETAGWKKSAARALGLDDRALTWLPDDPAVALDAWLAFVDHFATAGGKVIDDSGYAAYQNLRYAGEFYGQLASGNEAFRAEAARQLNGLVGDLGVGAKDTITLLGSLVAFSHDDPLSADIRTYERSPVLQQFTKQSGDAVDAALRATYDKVAHLARLAKSDPVAASGQLGDLLGKTFTTMGRDIVVFHVGGTGVARLSKAIEGALPFGRTGASLTSAVAAADPTTAALTASIDATGEVIVRESLESLGEGAVLTPAQLEQLGGFYAADAEKVQAIINEINAKYGVEIEVQCRPGNPASLQYYRNGTGVPKPEWVKPKNTEWMDVVLGAPPESLGKATVFKPVKPTAEALAKYTPAQQQTILGRYATQLELYEDATKEGGKFFQLIADSQKPGGATVNVGFGTGARQVKGLRYSLRAVGDAGQEAFVVIDEAAGGKFVLSDADYQAVVKKTGAHLPAGKRGQIELDFMNRLRKETVSFGGHGWSHSGFDLPSKYSKPFVQFVTESSSPAAARRTLEWFVARGELPEWVVKISTDLAAKLGRPPTSAELVAALLDKFRPGSFVVKFNGSNVRVGTAAGIR